jgi:fermentation-respiration switch protein FrsA (DUF1100 family)
MIRSFLLTLLLLATWAPPTYAMLEHRFIFFPDTSLHSTPTDVKLPFEDVTFLAEDGTPLHGWFIPGDAGRPVVLYCHGNAGNISDRLFTVRFLHQHGLSVLIFDYRGYGQSLGEASEAGTYSDARGARKWLINKGWSDARMIYLGRSLGAAVALQLAIEEPPAGLVLETPFTSIAEMGRHHYPLLFPLIGWLLEVDYDNRSKITRLKAPLLLIHGTMDEIVPVSMGEQLHAAAQGKKKLLLLNGAYHNSPFYETHPEYTDAWRDFISSTRP